MKAFVLVSCLVVISPNLYADGNGATITVGQSVDSTKTAELKVQLTRAQQFKRASCAAKDSKATSRPITDGTGKNPKSYKCSEIDDLIEELTNALSAVQSATSGGNSSACQSAYNAYDTAKTEASKACAKVGGCTSEKFKTCREHMEDYDGEFSDGDGLQEYLEACPFFAATEAKKKAEEVKELDAALDKIITDIKDLQEKAKTQKTESETRMKELKSEITTGQTEAQEALDDLQTTVQKMRAESSERQGSIVSSIRAIQAKMTELNTVEFGRVRNEYTKQVLEIEQQCYAAGLNAAAAEAQRLKAQKGIAMDELGQQMASGGAVGYLRSVANAAYEQCLKQGPFAKTSKAADDTYQERVKLLESQYNSMNQEIGSLKQSYAKMIENQPKEEQQVQLQVFNEAQAKARAVAAKEQEYASLAGQLRQEQAQIQMELGQLATKRFKAESELRKAKQLKTMADSKAGGGEVKDEDFSFAIGSFDASEDRLKSTRAVCKCSESTPDNLCSALGSSSNSRASGNSTREQ